MRSVVLYLVVWSLVNGSYFDKDFDMDFDGLIENSYRNCLRSYGILWNMKSQCDDGRKFFSNAKNEESDITFSSDASIDGTINNTGLFQKKTANNKICFNGNVMNEIGKSKQMLKEITRCEHKDVLFEGKILKDYKKLEFTLKCPNSSKRIV